MNMQLKNRPPSGRPRATHRIGEWLVENNYELARRHTTRHQGPSVPRPELYRQSSASGGLGGAIPTDASLPKASGRLTPALHHRRWDTITHASVQYRRQTVVTGERHNDV